MTPNQYYFPYFFNLNSFNKILRSCGLSSYIQYDHRDMAESVVIIKHKLFQSWRSKSDLMEIPFGMTIMVHQDNLLFWKTGYNSIDMFQINLKQLDNGSPLLHETIEVKLSTNSYDIKSVIELADFVTYLRLDELKYKTDFHEKYAIVIIDRSHIQMIPFDSFNKTGGDLGYVWPALARLDPSTLKIHGVGMRMSDFIVDLNYQDNI